MMQCLLIYITTTQILSLQRHHHIGTGTNTIGPVSRGGYLVLMILSSLILILLVYWYGIILEVMVLLLFGYGYHISSLNRYDDDIVDNNTSSESTVNMEIGHNHNTEPQGGTTTNSVVLLLLHKGISNTISDDNDHHHHYHDHTTYYNDDNRLGDLLDAATTTTTIQHDHHNNNEHVMVGYNNEYGIPNNGYRQGHRRSPGRTTITTSSSNDDDVIIPGGKCSNNDTLSKMKAMDDDYTKKWRILINKLTSDNISSISDNILNDIRIATTTSNNNNEVIALYEYYISKVVNLIFNAAIRTHHISNRSQLYLYINLLHNISSSSSGFISLDNNNNNNKYSIVMNNVLFAKCKSMYDEYVINHTTITSKYEEFNNPDDREDYINRFKMRTLALLHFIGALSITNLLSLHNRTTYDDENDYSCHDGMNMICKWIIDDKLVCNGESTATTTTNTRYNEYICSIMNGIIDYYTTTIITNNKRSKIDSMIIMIDITNTECMKCIIDLLKSNVSNDIITIRDKCLINNVLDKYNNLIMNIINIPPPPPSSSLPHTTTATTQNNDDVDANAEVDTRNNHIMQYDNVRYLTARGC